MSRIQSSRRGRVSRSVVLVCVPVLALIAAVGVSLPAQADAGQSAASPSQNQPAVVNFGVVKWFNDVKGFGSIVPCDDSEDVFVHHSGIVGDGFRTLNENDFVQYQVTQGPKGPQAVNVVVIPNGSCTR